MSIRSGFLTLVIGSVLTASPLMAAPQTPKPAPVSPNQTEALAMSALLEQVLNSVDKTSLDVEFDGLTITQGAATEETKVKADYASLSGMVQFNKDWNLDLVPVEPGVKVDPQISRLYPKLEADAKDLVAGVALEIRGDNIETSLRFFSGFDAKTQAWVPRPMTLQISNQMNKSLLSIRLHSLSAKVKSNTVNPSQRDVIGTCESDKLLLDLASGKNKLVKVACEFSGVVTEQGYQVRFKYMNRK